MFWPKPGHPQSKLYGPINRKIIILNVNILHFLCIVSQTNWRHVLGNKYIIWHYILMWAEIFRRKYNVK
jgi:hypothetical protein